MQSEVRYGLYDIDAKYLERIRKYDSHAPKSDYEDEGRAKKFYCGPVYLALRKT